MFLLPDGQMGKPGSIPNINALSGIGVHILRAPFPLLHPPNSPRVITLPFLLLNAPPSLHTKAVSTGDRSFHGSRSVFWLFASSAM
jgi:hypothetical protein